MPCNSNSNEPLGTAGGAPGCLESLLSPKHSKLWKRLPKICPVCEQTFHVPPSAAKRVHCSVGCRASGKSIQKICPTCSSSFRVYRSNAKYVYCSVGCKSRDKNIQKTCPVCNQPFSVFKSAIGQVYCSFGCASIGRSTHHWKDFRCLQCGATFQSKDRPHSNNSNHYCSLSCRNKAYRQNTGPKSPSWKGGRVAEKLRDRGRLEYREWRRSVFQRDDYTCQECGIRGTKLHAHHIKPYAEFPDLRFDVGNGVTLCLSCHGVVHHRTFYR